MFSQQYILFSYNYIVVEIFAYISILEDSRTLFLSFLAVREKSNSPFFFSSTAFVCVCVCISSNTYWMGTTTPFSWCVYTQSKKKGKNACALSNRILLFKSFLLVLRVHVQPLGTILLRLSLTARVTHDNINSCFPPLAFLFYFSPFCHSARAIAISARLSSSAIHLSTGPTNIVQSIAYVCKYV